MDNINAAYLLAQIVYLLSLKPFVDAWLTGEYDGGYKLCIYGLLFGCEFEHQYRILPNADENAVMTIYHDAEARLAAFYERTIQHQHEKTDPNTNN